MWIRPKFLSNHEAIYDFVNELLKNFAVWTRAASVLFHSSVDSVGKMKSIMSRSLSVFLAVFIAQAVCQDRSTVEVIEYLKTNHETSDRLCPATVITEKHVLTTAACAKASSHLMELAIELPQTNTTNSQETKSKRDFKVKLDNFLIAKIIFRENRSWDRFPPSQLHRNSRDNQQHRCDTCK